MTKAIFIPKGNCIFPQVLVDGESYAELPPKTYRIRHNPKVGFFFEEMEDKDFDPMRKIYGDTHVSVDRWLRTYEARKGNLGVLLVGERGGGKTLSALLTAYKMRQMGNPVLVIEEKFHGQEFNQFMEMIKQPCMILVDEFEKVYAYRAGDGSLVADQAPLLTLMDGVVGGGKKLFMFTCNKYDMIERFMKNRPSRVHYTKHIEGLPLTAVAEYIQDNLKDKSLLNLMQLSYSLGTYIGHANGPNAMVYDTLTEIVAEMNRYKEPANTTISNMFGIETNSYKDSSVALEVCGVFVHKEHGVVAAIDQQTALLADGVMAIEATLITKEIAIAQLLVDAGVTPLNGAFEEGLVQGRLLQIRLNLVETMAGHDLVSGITTLRLSDDMELQFTNERDVQSKASASERLMFHANYRMLNTGKLKTNHAAEFEKRWKIAAADKELEEARQAQEKEAREKAATGGLALLEPHIAYAVPLTPQGQRGVTAGTIRLDEFGKPEIPADQRMMDGIVANGKEEIGNPPGDGLVTGSLSIQRGTENEPTTELNIGGDWVKFDMSDEASAPDPDAPRERAQRLDNGAHTDYPISVDSGPDFKSTTDALRSPYGQNRYAKLPQNSISGAHALSTGALLSQKHLDAKNKENPNT